MTFRHFLPASGPVKFGQVSKMVTVQFSRVHSPGGAIALIESATSALENGLAPSLWIDMELVPRFLLIHPITVRRVRRHFEVVRGFRAFHVIASVCPPEQEITVSVTSEPDSTLTQNALFELVTNNLLYPLDSTEAKRNVYRVLKSLARELREKHRIKIPQTISAKSLRHLLGLDTQKTKVPRSRHSELTRLIGGS